jgi:uncharacterized membrane protein YfcA
MAGAAFEALGGAAAGAAGGVLSGLFGIGGGLVLIPLLGLLLRLPQHQAQGTALAAMLLPNGLPAVLLLRRRGVVIRWALVAALVAGFLPGVWLGARVANLLPEPPLRFLFASLLALLALRTLLQKPEAPGKHLETGAGAGTVGLPGMLIGLVGGVASGLLGIGGAILMIPLMVAWLRLPQHEAQAASLAMMLPPIGLPGVWVYARSGTGLPWWALGGVAAGFLAGAYGGARIATRTGGARLRQGFGVLMLGMALLLFMKGF